MAWRIEFSETAFKQFSKLDRQVQVRIRKFLHERLTENPRDFGDPLRRNLAGLWKYRIGNYRLVCEVQDERLTVLIVRVGHRRNVYVE